MHSNQNSIIFTFYLSPGNLNFISQFYRWISLEFELPENRESEWIPLERWEIFTVEFTQEFTRFNSGIHDVSLYFSVDSICLSGEFYIFYCVNFTTLWSHSEASEWIDVSSDKHGHYVVPLQI
jgi:hypothetical protein